MKNSEIKKIAAYARVSETTVYRAVNNLAGVSAGTKKRVLAAAEQMGIRRVQKPRQQILVGAALPSNPNYFWGRALAALRETAQKHAVSVRFSLSNHLGDAEDVLHSIDYLLECAPSAYLIVPAVSEEISCKIQLCSTRAPVVFLNEQIDMEDAYFVGEDQNESGNMLASAYISEFPERKKLLVLDFGSHYCSDRRTAAFLSAAKDRLTDFQTLIFDGRVSCLAAQIARTLSETMKSYRFDSILCTQGYLPEVCLALQKTGMTDVVCFGFENPKQNQKYIDRKILGAYVRQDIVRQAETAMILAAGLAQGGEFEEKNIYIPSRIFINKRNNAEN